MKVTGTAVPPDRPPAGAYAVFASCMYRPTPERFQAKWAQWTADPQVRICTAEEDGRLLGLLVLRRNETGADILGIAVDEACRHRGIGRTLIQAALDGGQPDLLTAETDDDAVGFYEKCGFTAEKTVVTYPDGPAVRYRCRIETRPPL